MLGNNVEEGRGWSQRGSCCVAAGGGREERRKMGGGEGGEDGAVVTTDLSAIVYNIPSEELR